MPLRGTSAVMVALTSAAIALVALQAPLPAPSFTPVGDGGLYMLTQWWRIIPGLPYFPVSVYLVKQSNSTSWGLIDTGLPDSPRQPHASQLLAALKATIPAGEELAAIVLTHSHGDHAGGLPVLLGAYPNASVVFYELEGPYLVPDADGKVQQLVEPDSLAARMLRWAGLLWPQPVTVPAERAKLLTEGLDSLAAYGLGDLDYVITLGHAPGHISIVHAPSRTMLAGDSLSFTRPSLRLANATADEGDPRVALTCKPWASLPGLTLRAEPQVVAPSPSLGGDREKATTSACLLAFAFHFDRLLASHDWALARPGGGGWTPERMKAWAAANPACGETLKLAKELGWESAKEGGEAAPAGARVQIKMGGDPSAQEEEDDEYAGSWDEEEAAAQPSQPADEDDDVEYEEALQEPSPAAASGGAEAAAAPHVPPPGGDEDDDIEFETALQEDRGGGRGAASAPAAAGPAAAATAAAAAAAAEVTFFPAAVWAKWTAAVLGVYLTYWLALARFVPRGRPVANFMDRERQPLLFRFIVLTIVAVLGSTYLLPVAGMAASGAWRAGLTYSLPVMVQLAINIAVEQISARKGRMLVVYSSTVANTMCRVVLALAALYDMSRLAVAPHRALWLVSAVQVVANAAVALLIVPAAISNLDVVTVEPLSDASANK
ncbi:hypothetical protein ABPG75_011470 [Micractinium tetrahymenae]